MSGPGFIVYALPRSRTFWLSRFLSFGGWDCGHDQLRFMRGLDDVKAWLGMPLWGTVETGAAPWWRLQQRLAPRHKVVVVRRPPEAVLDSMERIPGLELRKDVLWQTLWRMDRKLDQIEARVPGALSVRYQDLEQEAACAAVFEHCLGLAHQRDWWSAAAGANLQINFPALVRYVQANGEAMERLAMQATAAERGRLAARPLRAWGVTLGQERFEDFYSSAGELLSAQMVAIGERPGEFSRRNVELLRALDEKGIMLTTTARSAEGRLLGYLLTVISPSLQDPSQREALATSFYCLPEAPGLGLKLQRCALEALREAGVNKALFRAGIKANGPQLGALYRRLGAVHFGQMWELDLRKGDV